MTEQEFDKISDLKNFPGHENMTTEEIHARSKELALQFEQEKQEERAMDHDEDERIAQIVEAARPDIEKELRPKIEKEVKAKMKKAATKKAPEITVHEAFANAQAEMQDISPDGTNPHFQSAYATLGGILSEIRPILAKHGLSISQPSEAKFMEVKYEEMKDSATHVRYVEELQGHYLRTVITYKDGTTLPVAEMFIPRGGGIQQFGSALTYCRRYMLQSICGVGTDLDDDGNVAQEASKAVRGADAVKAHLQKK